jgi:hypothetical protein
MDRSRLILGTANFGNRYGISGGLSKEECFGILDAAWDLGIRWLDTARSYGDSEEIVGLHRREWRVMSKGDNEADRQRSSDILGVYLTSYLLHHRKTFTVPSGFDGISIYTDDELSGMTEERYTYVNFPLNIIDTRLLNILIGPFIFIARSVFIQGQAWKMPDIMGLPFAHLCWNFVYNHPNVDMMVFGVDSVRQLEAILSIPQYEIDYGKIGSEEPWIKSLA